MHTTAIIALLIFAAAAVSVLFNSVKQSAIVAFIATGIVAGLFREQIHLPHEVLDVFTELGILFLLFMAGLELDFNSFRARWKKILGNGFGQIILNTLAGIGVGAWVLGLRNPATLIFFGLSMTFSSTILVLGILKRRKETESLHGQLILGLMVMQDIVAVSSLVVLRSIAGGGALGVELLLVVAKLAGLTLLLWIAAKTFLPALFRYLAQSTDLVFLGSIGWSLGIAALCEVVHFSPEIGVFFAGATLSFLPYRLEIQDKVEPMKDFGIILFFLALGYGLDLSQFKVQYIAAIIGIGLFIVLFTPVLMNSLGYALRLKSRPSFYMGVIVNQISEFSLILATLSLEAGVFTEDVFTVVTFACIFTMFFSSLGHQVMDGMYNKLKPALAFIDRHSRMAVNLESEGFVLNDHIVLIGHSELAEAIIEAYPNKRILLIDVDPDLARVIDDRYAHVRCMYADAYDPDTWSEARMEQAQLVVSCLVNGQPAELGMAEYMKQRDAKGPFVATTASRCEALQLYEAGAAFVVQVEQLASRYTRELLLRLDGDFSAIAKSKSEEMERLRKQAADPVYNRV